LEAVTDVASKREQLKYSIKAAEENIALKPKKRAQEMDDARNPQQNEH